MATAIFSAPAGRTLAVAYAILCSAAAADCEPPAQPCYGIVPGDKIAITVLDSYGNSNYIQDGPVYHYCDFGLDLAKGQVLQATVVRSASSDVYCNLGVVTIAPFGAWTWTDNGMAGGGWPDILVGAFTATRASCRGWVQVGFEVQRDKDPFAPSVPGQVPNVVMTRVFVGAAGPDCPAMCTGSFVVNLQKI